MRRIPRVALLTLAVLAGCSEKTTAPTAPPSAPPAPASPAAPPAFTLTCDKSSFELGQTALNASCTLLPSNGFRGTIRIACAGHPAEVGCAFMPSEMAVTGVASLNTSLTLNRTIEAEAGTRTIQATAEGEGVKQTVDLKLTVPETCAGFWRQASFGGQCPGNDSHWYCLTFSDGYRWLTSPLHRGAEASTCFGMPVENTTGPYLPVHRHVLGTNLVKKG